MKKKGRICGTIGLILSLALAGGTVIYGVKFDKNATAHVKVPVPYYGAWTANFVDGWIVKGTEKNPKPMENSLNGTRRFLEKANELYTETVTTGGYTSYTLNLTYTSSAGITLKGNVAADGNYTRVQYSLLYVEDGKTVQTSAADYFLAKAKDGSAATWYTRTVNPYYETAADTVIMKDAKWVKMSAEDDGIKNVQALLVEARDLMNKVVSVNSFNNSFKVDGYNGEFTTGNSPTVRYEKEENKATISTVLEFSCLNNIEVVKPDSLKIGGGK